MTWGTPGGCFGREWPYVRKESGEQCCAVKRWPRQIGLKVENKLYK